MIKRFAPDTNFFLQFKKPRELPWRELGDWDEVHLIILDGVLGELDNHKNAPNERRSRRARDINSLLTPLIRGEVDEVVERDSQPRVVYRLAPDLSHDRERSPLLDPAKADHQILDEALACRDQAFSGELELLTDDNLTIKKSRAVHLQVQPLPERWRLPPQPDEKERRIRQLERELAAMKNHQPVIDVGLAVDGSLVDRINKLVPRFHAPNNEFVDRMMLRIDQCHPDTDPSSFGGIQVYREDDVETYRKKHRQWLSKLKGRLEDHAIFLNFARGFFLFNLVLTNDGATPAEDAEVDIRAEGDIRLVDLEAHEEMMGRLSSTLPGPPEKRFYHSLFREGDVVASGRMMDMTALTRGLVPRANQDPRWFYWKVEDPAVASTHIKGSCKDFRHRVDPIYRQFGLAVPSDKSGVAEGRLVVRVSSRNLPDPVVRYFPVRLDYDWEDVEVEIKDLVKQDLGVQV